VKNAHRGTYPRIAAAASNTRRLPACCHSACVTPGLGSRAPNPRKRTGQGALWSLDATLRQTSRKQLIMYRGSLSCEVSFRVLSWRTLASKTIERYNWNFKISGYRLRQVRRARAREEGSSIDPQEGPKGDFATTGICKETLNFAARRRQVFFQYVSEVQPEHSDQFSKYAPPAVEGAMRETINNLLGSLPPTYFSVSVSSVTENLAQLMYSMMMTGYMFRNAQYCMELRKSVVPVEVPPSLASSETPVEISDDLEVQGISMVRPRPSHNRQDTRKRIENAVTNSHVNVHPVLSFVFDRSACLVTLSGSIERRMSLKMRSAPFAPRSSG